MIANIILMFVVIVIVFITVTHLIKKNKEEVVDEEVIQKIYGIHLPVRQVDGDIAVLAVGKRDIDTDKR